MLSKHKWQSAVRVLAALTAGIAIHFAPSASANSGVPNPVVSAIPYDAGAKHHPFMSSWINLPALGYTESEYQMSGTANIYDADGRWSSDGVWNTKIAQANVPYTTRLIVRRPTDPAKFNGTVVVEWLNDTAQFDTDAIWGQTHVELVRDGYAWIGVTTQTVGAKQLKVWDPERYGAVDVAQGVSFDIFSQAGQAIRSQAALILGGASLKHVIGGGESQSAIFMVTYVDAFQADARQVYDGILIYSRFFTGVPVDPMKPLAIPLLAYIRSDTAIKVMQIETEEDVGLFRFSLSRQADTDSLRTWEVAGTSHYDEYGVDQLESQARRDLPLVANIPIGCKNPANQLPFHYVISAAIVAFNQWIDAGTPPPHSPLIDIARGKVVRDAYGNAKGGIRLPEMEAPTAVNNYDNSPGNASFVSILACPFLGNTAPFSAATLAALYPTHHHYVSKFTRAAKAALDAGFLLQPDYDEAVSSAKVANIPN
jgi:hypothetical protein